MQQLSKFSCENPDVVLEAVFTRSVEGLGRWRRFWYSTPYSKLIFNRSKQGNVPLRFLPFEATHNTVRSHPEWRRHFMHLTLWRGRGATQVATARELAVIIQRF